MSFRKLGVEVEGLLTIEECLFVLSLFDVRHGPIREHSFILVELNRFCVESNGLVHFSCLQCFIPRSLLLFSLCGHVARIRLSHLFQ